MNEEERTAVEFLRQEVEYEISSKYDTDYNLLRWAQGYGFDLQEASAQLKKHLKFRQFYDLDNVQQIKEHDILRKYFPVGLVGETGENNQLLVIECAGRIDLMGILKSVHLSDFLIQRYRFQERMLDEMNALEKRTGKQASVIYILDLEGLKFDPALLSIVTGPYRLLWASVYTNYPEWISTMLIVNAPPFMGVVWKAIGPLLPERTRNKVKICTTNVDWKAIVQKYAKAECVPKHWGGRLVDANGDAMCRDRLNIPNDAIPQHLYWKPCADVPLANEIDAVTMSAGKYRILTFSLKPSKDEAYLVLNRFCDRTFGMSIWYHEDHTTDRELSEMNEWFPEFDYPGMPTTDYLRVKALGHGLYKVKLSNEKAWIRSLTVNFRLRFQNDRYQDLELEQWNE